MLLDLPVQFEMFRPRAKSLMEQDRAVWSFLPRLHKNRLHPSVHIHE